MLWPAGVDRGWGTTAAGAGGEAATARGRGRVLALAGDVADGAGAEPEPGGTAAELGIGNWHTGQDPPCDPVSTPRACSSAGTPTKPPIPTAASPVAAMASRARFRNQGRGGGSRLTPTFGQSAGRRLLNRPRSPMATVSDS